MIFDFPEAQDESLLMLSSAADELLKDKPGLTISIVE